MRTDVRARYCGQYCIQTVIRLIGIDWKGKVIIGRASGISHKIA